MSPTHIKVLQPALSHCLWVTSLALHTHLVPLQEPEAQEVLQFPQADGTEVQGTPYGLIQAKCPLQEAAEPTTAP